MEKKVTRKSWKYYGNYKEEINTHAQVVLGVQQPREGKRGKNKLKTKYDEAN